MTEEDEKNRLHVVLGGNLEILKTPIVIKVNHLHVTEEVEGEILIEGRADHKTTRDPDRLAEIPKGYEKVSPILLSWLRCVRHS